MVAVAVGAGAGQVGGGVAGTQVQNGDGPGCRISCELRAPGTAGDFPAVPGQGADAFGGDRWRGLPEAAVPTHIPHLIIE